MMQFTEEQRKALIDVCENVLASLVQYGGDSEKQAIYEIALTSLTTEPIYQVLTVSNDWIDAEKSSFDRNCEGDRRIVYTLPPVGAPAVPDGWKLLPVEPTEEIKSAIIDGIRYDIYPEGIYADVLAAAPSPTDSL